MRTCDVFLSTDQSARSHNAEHNICKTNGNKGIRYNLIKNRTGQCNLAQTVTLLAWEGGRFERHT